MAVKGLPLINGVAYTHADILMTIAGVPIIEVTSISYSDAQTMGLNYGTGNHPTSRGFGNVTPEASITISMKEAQRLSASIPSGRLQDIPAFDIGINFATEAGDFVRHALRQVKFMGRSVESETNNTQIEEELELSVAAIDWKA